MEKLKLLWRKCTPPNFGAIPEKEGVYIISTRQKSDHRYEVKYVGKTADLKECAKQHWSDSEQNAALRTHIKKNYVMKFSYALVPDGGNRDGVEAYLYYSFRPAFNAPEARIAAPIPSNLPPVRGKATSAKGAASSK